ncbi:uncharacterized protein LOC115244024 [Formica exsecta]|uniref:uncharacterized protein LOC115244024 n=1 Tax=Formica exsecta TaxID=72781 RepID=UPI001144A4B7|nr:uncharacterized protein LOC115244024 [Formica exsecta]
MRLVSFFLACSPIFLTSSSRCPESKKPHLTSCTIFYNCVNLPDDGYVWIPSKCTEGLVFQPYLRMCVVPGDTWTCDWTPSTEHTLVTNKYETPTELVGYPTDTSSLGYTQDPFSNVIDSSYVIDNFSEPTSEAVTAYPLIEYEESDVTMRDDEGVRNVSYHKEENYLYEYYMNKQVPLSLTEEFKNIIDSHYKCLNELINRLHNYKKLSAISSSLSIPIRDITTVKPPKAIAIFASHKRKHNITLNYFVQSYTEGNVKLDDDKPTEMKENEAPQTDDSASILDNDVSTENTLQLLIDSLDYDNNIIRISDNLGNKQYLTIDEYKTVASRLTSRYVTVVACTKNVRLPNRTDCNRYYTCDPKTASVVEFSCPLHTAFNVNSRICDIESSKTCGNKLPVNEIFIEHREQTTTDFSKKLTEEERLCQELGKIKDPTSDSHYYICYSMPGSEDIKSIRMSCPNALIFCQGKRVCTTRRLCDMSQ